VEEEKQFTVTCAAATVSIGWNKSAIVELGLCIQFFVISWHRNQCASLPLSIHRIEQRGRGPLHDMDKDSSGNGPHHGARSIHGRDEAHGQ
jgi:hypothetical protein